MVYSFCISNMLLTNTINQTSFKKIFSLWGRLKFSNGLPLAKPLKCIFCFFPSCIYINPWKKHSGIIQKWFFKFSLHPTPYTTCHAILVSYPQHTPWDSHHTSYSSNRLRNNFILEIGFEVRFLPIFAILIHHIYICTLHHAPCTNAKSTMCFALCTMLFV